MDCAESVGRYSVIIDNRKICGHCKNWRDISKFGKCKRSPDGLYYICKLCKREYDRNYYADNSERIKEQAYKLRFKDHEGYKQYMKNWRVKNGQKKD